jgi:hypothetical protein
MVGAAAYALGPLDGLGDDTAEFLLYTLTPRLVAAMLLLHLSLLRWVGRFPVKVYAGEHPVVRKVSLYRVPVVAPEGRSNRS